MEGYRNIKETYKIEGTIGKGSFATVKKAKHRESGDRFAVKVLSKKKMNDDDKAAMQTEIDILKQVDHPNIVKLYDVFDEEKSFYLVMELMTGGEVSVFFLTLYSSLILFWKRNSIVKKKQQKQLDL